MRVFDLLGGRRRGLARELGAGAHRGEAQRADLRFDPLRLGDDVGYRSDEHPNERQPESRSQGSPTVHWFSSGPLTIAKTVRGTARLRQRLLEPPKLGELVC